MRNKTVFAVLTFLAMCLSGAAFAQAPSTGLGQSWPNTQDVSASPNYHVFVFVLGGVRYIQVNDFYGNILGSVGQSGSRQLKTDWLSRLRRNLDAREDSRIMTSEEFVQFVRRLRHHPG